MNHVADVDLSKCFDRLDSILILSSIRRRGTDGSVLALAVILLTGGAMHEGDWMATELRSPQGGMASPLIVNIYLDTFDPEIRRCCSARRWSRR
ncbi:reverse transcriptase domain-containing protein [Neorhodopirellula lusitana]|uniref:reverse transcriptase domain-containing protein n=1 Tax=Neorhodopirellula lusitana TaxID=445327 RepID=UPI0024B784B7|nr:reverse transcriptase domain-containing protein [Neorhodopirellula lusitana]